MARKYSNLFACVEARSIACCKLEFAMHAPPLTLSHTLTVWCWSQSARLSLRDGTQGQCLAHACRRLDPNTKLNRQTARSTTVTS